MYNSQMPNDPVANLAESYSLALISVTPSGADPVAGSDALVVLLASLIATAPEGKVLEVLEHYSARLGVEVAQRISAKKRMN